MVSSGKISKEQRDGEWQVWQTRLQNPNFAEYAKLCGGDGVRVEKTSQLDAAFEKAIASKGVFLVEDIDGCIAHINLF